MSAPHSLASAAHPIDGGAIAAVKLGRCPAQVQIATNRKEQGTNHHQQEVLPRVLLDVRNVGRITPCRRIGDWSIATNSCGTNSRGIGIRCHAIGRVGAEAISIIGSQAIVAGAKTTVVWLPAGDTSDVWSRIVSRLAAVIERTA